MSTFTNPFPPASEKKEPAPQVTRESLDMEAVHDEFELAFKTRINDFTRSLAARGKGVYVNDRTEGKFQGFLAAVLALENGRFSEGDLRK